MYNHFCIYAFTHQCEDVEKKIANKKLFPDEIIKITRIIGDGRTGSH